MKMTIVVDEKGELVGAMHGHIQPPDFSKAPEREGREEIRADRKDEEEFRAGLMAGPGQRLFEIEVPDELERIEDAEEFGRRLSRHIFEQGLVV